MRVFRQLLPTAVTLFAISACSVNNQRPGASKYWGNHKCIAVSQDNQSYQGWATDKASAENSALQKCQQADSSGECHISSCN